MTSFRTKAVSTASLLAGISAVAGVALMLAAPAGAQTNAAPQAASAAPAAPAGPTLTGPRRPGVFSAGSIDAVKYTPTCGDFDVGIDAAAIQESTSRTFILEQERLFNGLQDRWDAWQDCITQNANIDYLALQKLMADSVRVQLEGGVTNYNATSQAAQAAVSRIQALGSRAAPKKEKKRRGKEEAVAAVAEVVEPEIPLPTWSMSGDRAFGSLSGGTVDAIAYTSGCPAFDLRVSPEGFGSVTSGATFNSMITALNAGREPLLAWNKCVGDEANKDFKDIEDVINTGASAVLNPAIARYSQRRGAIQTQLNFHRAPGGVLAPADVRRPPAKAAPKKKKN